MIVKESTRISLYSIVNLAESELKVIRDAVRYMYKDHPIEQAINECLATAIRNSSTVHTQ